jgi:Arc/MetJ-type ribon-helix-helix transcriptional regulator
MATLWANLPSEASQDIARLIASGRYKSVDEVLIAAARNLVTLEEEKAAVELVPLRLTTQIEWSDGQCCAYCPELDLATAMGIEEKPSLTWQRWRWSTRKFTWRIRPFSPKVLTGRSIFHIF